MSGILTHLKNILVKEIEKQEEFMQEHCHMRGALFFEKGIEQYSEKLSQEYNNVSILAKVFLNRKVYDETNAVVTNTVTYISNESKFETILSIMKSLDSQVKVCFCLLY